MAVERAPGGTSLIDVLDRVSTRASSSMPGCACRSSGSIDYGRSARRRRVDRHLFEMLGSRGAGRAGLRPQAELTAHQNVIAENASLRAELAAAKSARKGRRRVVAEG